MNIWNKLPKEYEPQIVKLEALLDQSQLTVDKVRNDFPTKYFCLSRQEHDDDKSFIGNCHQGGKMGHKAVNCPD